MITFQNYDDEQSRADFRERLQARWAATFRPAPKLNLVQWADQYRHLSTVSSNFGGLWRTSRFEIARGPMLATTEPGVETITCEVATQTMKTELLLNIIGRQAH